jgi:hypothetical protein
MKSLESRCFTNLFACASKIVNTEADGGGAPASLNFFFVLISLFLCIFSEKKN